VFKIMYTCTPLVVSLRPQVAHRVGN